MRAITLLSWWQLRNSVRTLFTDPKKLLPFLFFAFIIGSNVWLASMAPQHHDRSNAGIARFVVLHPVVSRAALTAIFAVGALLTLGQGFTGKALVFSPADVDYLFPSPVPRRVVLAYKLPGLMLKQALGAVALVYFVYLYLWRNLPAGPGALEVALLFLGAALWLAFYTNLAAAAEVAFGLGKAAAASRVIQAALVLIVAWAAFVVWRSGLPGLAALEHNIVFTVLFYPCRLLADVMLSPVTGSAMGAPVALLALLCAGSLAVALSRRENYYEATLEHAERVARIRRAAREGNAFAAWSIRSERRAKPARDFDRPYALEPFGKGATAVLWAHLTALAKRPLLNFAAPFAVGLAVSVGALLWFPRSAATFVGVVAGYFLFFSLMVGARTQFRASVQRRSLIRPLPIAPWRLVAVEVGAAVLPGTLAAWGAGLPLLGGDGSARLLAGLLIVAAPPLLLATQLIAYACAFWYPDSSDKTAQLIVGFVMMALLGVLMIVLAPFIVVPVVLRLPHLLVPSVMLGCLAACAGLLPIAAYAFVKSEG